MNRGHLATSDEQLALEFGRLLDHFNLALTQGLSTEALVARINEGSRLGLTWVEALEHAAAGRKLG